MDERCHTILVELSEMQRNNIEHIKRLAQYQWSEEFHGLKDTGKLATREELEKCLIDLSEGDSSKILSFIHILLLR